MSMKVQQAKRAAEAGFTLIELMIVIAIIGILAAIAIPQYEQYITTSKATTITQDFHQLVTQGTAAVAAAAAGQTTSIAAPGTGGGNTSTTGTVDGYTFTLSSNSVSPTNSTFSVTLSGGTGSLATAVGAAFSSMNLQGSGNAGSGSTTASACNGGTCKATISSNGGVLYTAS